jgi:energy-coupling factor transporter ATP-binding protein EcfA2
MVDIEQHRQNAASRMPRASAGGAPESMHVLPPQPKSVQETGLTQQLLVELVAKTIFIGAKCHLQSLATTLRLSINVLRELLGFMVAEQLAEVAWRGESDVDIQYRLTAGGKERASAYFERSAYIGPAPVTFDAYRAMVERQGHQCHGLGAGIGSEDVTALFGGDELDPRVLDTIGAALHSGRSLLVYGAPGSGKTRLANKLGQLLPGMVAVPYAVLIGQEIVQLHDPLVHPQPSASHTVQARQLLERRNTDIRWTLCLRPVVRVGAELSGSMLELQHDASAGCYQAPPQLKANNGMLVIDDLGRQRISAPDLVRRLLQPLDKGLDLLSLRSGQTFSVPSDVMLVLVTCQPPHSMLDESLLRRLGYKIHIPALTADAYRRLFRQQCQALELECREAVLTYLVEHLHAPGGRALLASYPRELLNRISDFAGFAGVVPQLTVQTVEQAWYSMFAGGPDATGTERSCRTDAAITIECENIL